MEKQCGQAKRLVRMGFGVVAAGLIFAGCASTGSAAYSPPDGVYLNGSQGEIVFKGGGDWEADRLGYRGSFDFNRETAGISLTVEQQLVGFRWEDIDPIRDFSTGQVKGDYVNLGDSWFVLYNE